MKILKKIKFFFYCKSIHLVTNVVCLKNKYQKCCNGCICDIGPKCAMEYVLEAILKVIEQEWEEVCHESRKKSNY